MTTTLLYSIPWSVGLAVVAIVTADLGTGVVAVSMPLLLAQDVARYAVFADHAPARAALLDGIWTVIALIGIPFVLEGDASAALAVWAIGGSIGGVIGILRCGLDDPQTAMRWWSVDARQFGTALALSGLAYTVGSQGLFLGLAAISGLATLGTLRAGLIYFGPLQLTLTALGLILLPRLTNVDIRASRPIYLSVRLATAMALACTALYLMRGWFLPLLLGNLQVPDSVVLILAIATVVNTLGWALTLFMRSTMSGSALLAVYVAAYVVGTVPALALANAMGLTGAAYGLLLQGALLVIASLVWLKRGVHVRS